MATTRLKLEEAAGDAISRIRFAPHSNNLLFSSWDAVLRLYDVDSSVLRFEAPTKAALINCCFQDESTALSVGSDCCIRRYDLCSGVQHIVGRHNDLPNCIEYCKEVGQVITAGLDKTIMFWDMRMANDRAEHRIMVDAEVESISICGFYLLVASGMTINFYDLRNLKESHQIIASADHQIKCISSFPNCQGYVTGSVDGCVALGYFDSFDQHEMGYIFRCCRKGADGKHYHAAVNDFAFHPSYGTFVTGDNEGSAIIWDGQSRKRLLELPRYPNSVASLSFSCSGEILAVASSYTYQEANEVQEPPQIFINEMIEDSVKPFPVGHSGRLSTKHDKNASDGF